MKRILLLGSKGRLGAALARNWSRTHDVAARSRADIDVSNPADLASLLEAETFDILVNATGLTSLEACEENPELAHRINAEAVEVMAEKAKKKHARLIHFSTDYVFDGRSPLPYTEQDHPAPLSHYGYSKRAGEEVTLHHSANNLVFRVSWVFGPDKPSFVDMILNRAQIENSLEAIADKTSSPTYTEDVADWLRPFIEQDAPGGLYHACNQGSCSWHGLGEEALQIAANQGWKLQTKDIRPLQLKEMKAFKAERPVQTAMSTDKLASVIGKSPRSWTEALRTYVENLSQR